VTRAVR